LHALHSSGGRWRSSSPLRLAACAVSKPCKRYQGGQRHRWPGVELQREQPTPPSTSDSLRLCTRPQRSAGRSNACIGSAEAKNAPEAVPFAIGTASKSAPCSRAVETLPGHPLRASTATYELRCGVLTLVAGVVAASVQRSGDLSRVLADIRPRSATCSWGSNKPESRQCC